MKKRILSGMRPTGRLHLGHLVGALKSWVLLQDKYDCFFMAADWHALMSEYKDPARLKEYALDNVIDWLSCGIDPEKATLFVQSEVPQHLELFMVLSCFTPLGWLERCPTYKEQLRELKLRELNNYAFLGYPVLQAADILLYKAELVPVGEDQLPHLELTREIAKRFNHLLKCSVFPQPQAELTRFPRLLGLDRRKMSKSYNNYIGLEDSAAEISKKVKSMFTDPLRIKKTDAGHPATCNVYNYYDVFANPQLVANRQNECITAAIGCTECKEQLVKILLAYLAPIQQKRTQLLKDKDKVWQILDAGAKKAQQTALFTMTEIRKVIGL